MARFRKKRGGSRKAKSIPISIAVPLVAVGYTQVVVPAMQKNTREVVKNLTGYDISANKFVPSEMVATYAPLAAGWLVHKVAGRTGINNHVRRATMGYLSI